MPKTPRSKQKKRKLSRGPSALYSHCKLTRETIHQAAKIVADGNFRKHAFAAMGVPYHRWHTWIKEGRKELREHFEGKREAKECTLYSDLVLALEKAEGKCAVGMLHDVTKAKNEHGNPDVRAREWFLERRYNKLYTRNPNARVDGEESEEDEQPRGREILLGRLLIALGRTVGGDDDA